VATPASGALTVEEVNVTAVDRSRGWRALLAGLGVAMLVACGGDDDGGSPPLPPQPAVAPSITAQPQPATVTEGQSASFSVSATGTAPLAYQWRRNGSAISGATAAGYTLAAAAIGDSGAVFSVVVTNSAGTVTSSDASLTVNAAPPPPPPGISAQPQNASVTVGQTATFSVTATGGAPLAYQWRRNGIDIAGATGASYTTPATALTDDGALFTVAVSNAAGSVTSTAATLTVAAVPPPVAVGDRLVATVGFTLALRADGLLVGWGDNRGSALGSGAAVAGTLARQIATGVERISAGELGGVALKTDGSVVGWGTNTAGWLGGEAPVSGPDPVYASPQAVAWPRPVQRVSVQSRQNENSFLFALAADGTVWHMPGERAISGSVMRYSARQSGTLADVVDLATGHGLMHVVRQDGTVWRFDMFTTVGEPLRYDAVATQVDGLAAIARVSCGVRHCLALARDGTVWAWGEGRSGELGNGASASSAQPVRVLNLTGVTHIAATSVFGASIARTSDGRVWTWGSGELSGRPDVPSGALSLPPPDVNVPTLLPSLAGIAEIACSDRHCVARAADGAVWAWGDNLTQQLGVTGPRRQVPVVVTGINLN
jgi:alpha-tubulin suppressor-like RCC1 family protein